MRSNNSTFGQIGFLLSSDFIRPIAYAEGHFCHRYTKTVITMKPHQNYAPMTTQQLQSVVTTYWQQQYDIATT